MQQGKLVNGLLALGLIFTSLVTTNAALAKGKITHDADYHILEAQNGEKWKADDKLVDQLTAVMRSYVIYLAGGEGWA